jgi:hypothetical protein
LLVVLTAAALGLLPHVLLLLIHCAVLWQQDSLQQQQLLPPLVPHLHSHRLAPPAR